MAILHWRPAMAVALGWQPAAVAVAVAVAVAPVGPRDIRRAEFNSLWRYHSFLLFSIYHFCGCGVVRTCHMLQIFHGAALLHRSLGPRQSTFFRSPCASCLLQTSSGQSSLSELLVSVPGGSHAMIGVGTASLCFSRPPSWNIPRLDYQLRGSRST